MDVPTDGLEQTKIGLPSGYGNTHPQIVSRVHQYCDVAGYVAPQNKFELKLPSPGEWNQKFFFMACGGFCGYLDDRRCNLPLARGYASVTGNGVHDSVLGFDGVWAANAPELQEDFGWRSNHVVTLIAKAITTHYYGKPIKYSYMAGNSKGGQAVFLEAQRFPEDFDGLMPRRRCTTTPDVTRLLRPGLRKASATETAALCLTPRPPKQCINQCWSIAALKLGLKKVAGAIIWLIAATCL